MSINRQMARGALWTVGLRMFDRSIGFVSTLILARLLLPEDFGLVAMATVFLHLLYAVSDFNVQVPLIQKPSLDREDMDSAWTLQCLIGLAQGGVLLAIAQPASAFYEEPRLVPVIYVLAAIAGIGALKNIGIVMFVRDMTFDRDFIYRAIQRVSGFFVTISIALVWTSYWALVIGMFISALVALLLSYTMHPFRPRPSIERWRGLIGFSKWMLLNNLFTYISARAPDFLLGRLYGARSVGLYSISYEIAMLPTSELAAPINRVALPGYSKMRRDNGELQRGFLDVIGLITLVGLPAGMGVAATADLVVPVLLGDKWLEAIPIIQYLAIAGALTTLMTNTGAVMLAQGRPAVPAILQAMRVALLLPGIYFGALMGDVVGVAIAFLIVTCLALTVNIGVALYSLSLSLLKYFQVVYRPAASSAAMYFALKAYILQSLTEAIPSQIAAAIAAIVIGATVFILAEVGLWALAKRPAGAEARAIQILSEALSVRSPSISAWLDRQKRN